MASGQDFRTARDCRLQGRVGAPRAHLCAKRARAGGRGATSRKRSRNCRRDRGFASGFASWLVEGCRMAQPLEPLMGSRLETSKSAAAGRARFGAGGRSPLTARTVPVGAPALLGARGRSCKPACRPALRLSTAAAKQPTGAAATRGPIVAEQAEQTLSRNWRSPTAFSATRACSTPSAMSACAIRAIRAVICCRARARRR